MRRTLASFVAGGMGGWLAAGVCVSVVILIWSGWRATQQWQRSEELLADRRAHETVNRFVTALGRDMRSVQESILSSWWEQLTLDPPDDVRNVVASAFAKYPYPESFFAWRRTLPDDSVTFFNRPDRRPEGMPPDDGQNRFPVSIGHHPVIARTIFDRIHVDVRQGRRFSIFEMPFRGARYQVVARLFYRDGFREKIEAIVGFTVNLPWVRRHYFPEVGRQVEPRHRHAPARGGCDRLPNHAGDIR